VTDGKEGTIEKREIIEENERTILEESEKKSRDST